MFRRSLPWRLRACVSLPTLVAAGCIFTIVADQALA